MTNPAVQVDADRALQRHSRGSAGPQRRGLRGLVLRDHDLAFAIGFECRRAFGRGGAAVVDGMDHDHDRDGQRGEAEDGEQPARPQRWHTQTLRLCRRCRLELLLASHLCLVLELGLLARYLGGLQGSALLRQAARLGGVGDVVLALLLLIHVASLWRQSLYPYREDPITDVLSCEQTKMSR